MRTSLTHFIRRHAAIAGFAIVLPAVACDDASEPLAPGMPVEVEQRQVAGTVITHPASALADFPISLRLGGDEVRGGSVEWIFSDGTRQRGARVTKSFADSGLTTVNVRVTDEDGRSYGVTRVIEVGPSIASLATAMVGIVPGGLNNCAIDATSAVYCWGSNEHGIVGDGTTTDRHVPTKVAGDVQFSQIASGLKHSCALSLAGEAYCWGRNFAGQLGDGTTTDRVVPTKVAGNLLFSSIDVGQHHTCAVSTLGSAYCWGSDEYGQLGDAGTPLNRLVPQETAGARLYSVVRTGNSHTCAIESVTAKAYCWGANSLGQVGSGTGGNSLADVVTSPVEVKGPQSAYTQLDAGGSHTCGISGNFAYCWGSNGSGQIGTTSTERCGTLPCMRNPTRISSPREFSAVGLGTAHTCALDGATGESHCWGYNAFGQLGNGTTTSTATATLVPNMAFKTIRGGNGYTCGVGVDNKGYCWGINAFGTLGVGDTTNRLTPAQVVTLTF